MQPKRTATIESELNLSEEEEQIEEKLSMRKFKDALLGGDLDPMVLNHLILDRYDNCFTCIEINRRMLRNKEVEGAGELVTDG